MKTTAWLVLMGVGKWLGYALFGFFADSVGRRRSYVTYLLVAAALVPLYGLARRPALAAGPRARSWPSSGPASSPASAPSPPELFPTEIRATAMGVSYNLGRGLSAAAPAVVGLLATRFGLGSAFFLQAAAFFARGSPGPGLARDEGEGAGVRIARGPATRPLGGRSC